MPDLAESHIFVPHRYQTIVSLALLTVLVGSILVTDLLSRNRSLEKSLMSLSSEFAKKTNTVFSNTGNFIDYEDRVLLDEIPQADYSRGGVYFFGTSTMKWAFTTWDLPVEEKRFIGNYGIGASTHSDQLRLIQYLIEQRGFLTAGNRDLVILGLTYSVGRRDPPTGYFASLLRRHGLYTITADEQIVPVPMSAVESWLRVEKARSSGFIWNVGRVAKGWVSTLAGFPIPHRGGSGHLTITSDSWAGPNGHKIWMQN